MCTGGDLRLMWVYPMLPPTGYSNCRVSHYFAVHKKLYKFVVGTGAGRRRATARLNKLCCYRECEVSPSRPDGTSERL